MHQHLSGKTFGVVAAEPRHEEAFSCMTMTVWQPVTGCARVMRLPDVVKRDLGADRCHSAAGHMHALLHLLSIAHCYVLFFGRPSSLSSSSTWRLPRDPYRTPNKQQTNGCLTLGPLPSR